MPTPNLKANLLKRLADRTARVGVIGLGYVGMSLIFEKAREGFRVTGIDLDTQRVDRLKRGENLFADLDSAQLKAWVQAGAIQAVADYTPVPDLDVIVICVPTPMTRNLVPDLSCVKACTEALAQQLKPGQFVVLESTTYPGTTEEVVRPILERGGLKAETDFYLAFSPERVDPGNKQFQTRNTNKVIGAVGPESLEVGLAFYKDTVPRMVAVTDTRTAEMVKIFENVFRAVNIGLVNEMCQLCDRMDLNVWEVLDAAFTKPFGIMPFYPGPGVGGHCIPIDPHYLEWKAREYEFVTKFIGVAGEVNRSMPMFVVQKVGRLLNRMHVALSSAKILVLGVAYKPNVGDYRESPALILIDLLRKQGADLCYHDPCVPTIDHEGWTMTSQPLTEALVQSTDLVLIVTAHPQVDYSWITHHARHVLDTRNATRMVRTDRQKISLL